jgi:demethylmenaquinone methyltransferase/2-methoxy-6-polyprenyl-1,4-benzoquinol methylase
MPPVEKVAPALDRGFEFGDIAGSYDRLNRLMSLGQDQRWRELAADELRADGDSRVLDVGTGTGQTALAVRERYPSTQIVALDAASELIGRARQKGFAPTVSWMLADAFRLPFPDGYFDAVVSVFFLRNAADVLAALMEQRRVVRPAQPDGGNGGRVVSLELVWPRSRPFGPFFRLYFAHLLPALNRLLGGSRAAYSYLPRSVERFDSPERLAAKMEQAGLRQVRYRTLACGTVALHVGERGSEP